VEDIMSIRWAAIVAALFLAFSGAARAQDRGFYLGAGGGQSKALNPVNCSEGFDLNFPFTCNSSNDTATGWKVFGGYQFSKYLAAEAGYFDLGKFKTSATGLFQGFGGSTVTTQFHPTGFNVDAIGTLPLGEGFGLLARVGLFRWTLKSELNVNTIAVSSSETKSEISADFGLGAKWDFARNMGARVEWQRFTSIGSGDTGKSDVDLISLSLLYRFN